MSRKWRKWYQYVIDEEIKGASSREKMKHNERREERSVIFCEDDVGGRARVTTNGLTHFVHSSKMGTVTKEFDARLANRPFLVFDFRALWRSTCISVRVAESQKVKMVG